MPDRPIDHSGASALSAVPGRLARAETARRWNDLVRAYSAPGTNAVLHQVPDRIHRPLGPTARRARSRIDATLRRQAVVTARIAAGTLAVLGGATVAGSPHVAIAAGVATTVTGGVAGARWWRLDAYRTVATKTDGYATWDMTRLGRWLVARAHQATVRATEVDGGPADTADRMIEALYQFTGDVRSLEHTIAASSTFADSYGRLRRVPGDVHRVDALLDAQAQVLRALDLFESTAQEVVLAAYAERPVHERPGVVSSLLDLQAEALSRSEALAALDDTHVPEPPARGKPS